MSSDSNLEWINDVQAKLDPIQQNFAVYETIILNGNIASGKDASGSETDFNATYRIAYEGVYSTYFIFGKYRAGADSIGAFEDEVDDHGDGGDGRRALVPA